MDKWTLKRKTFSFFGISDEEAKRDGLEVVSVDNNGTIIYKNNKSESFSANMNTGFHSKNSLSDLMEDYKDEIKIKPNITENNERTEEELERLKAIKKPRGWAFKAEYIDSEGNIYHKGKLV